MDSLQSRQGDILFESGDSQFNRWFAKNKKNLVPKDDRKVALGETTGHSHTFSGGTVLIDKKAPDLGQKVIFDSPAEVTHEEHSPIPFEGVDEVTVTHQRIGSFFGMRKVRD